MRKLFLLSVMLLFSFTLSAGAVRLDNSFDIMREIYKGGTSSLILFAKSLPVSNAKTYKTAHFIIYYGEDVPATSLWADYSGNGIPDFIDNVSQILEYVWDKEINQFGFKEPPGYLPIPVYIANTGILVNGEELTLSGEMCGYAMFDGVQSHIILNANPPSSIFTKPIDMLKVTIAHEFFHLVQYAYKIDVDTVEKWLYEGTATWMENQVYPDINDYIYSYAGAILSYPEKGLVYPEGLTPYGTSLFFDYLSQKFGAEIVKDIWKNFQLTSNSLEALDKTLKSLGTSLSSEVYQFYMDLREDQNNFSDGELLQELIAKGILSLKTILLDCDDTVSEEMGILGAEYIENSCGVVSTLVYDSNGGYILNGTETAGIAANIAGNQMVVIYYPQNIFSISEPIVDNVTSVAFEESVNVNIHEGWNLVGFKGEKFVDFLNREEIISVWKWSEGKWEVFIPDYYPSLKEVAEKYGLASFEKIMAGEGVWIKAIKPVDVEDNVFSGGFAFQLDDTWTLASFPSYVPLNFDALSKIYPIELVWKWDGDNWSVFVPSENSELLQAAEEYGIKTFVEIEGKELSGFWIKRLDN
jgi:hypothetical protein